MRMRKFKIKFNPDKRFDDKYYDNFHQIYDFKANHLYDCIHVSDQSYDLYDSSGKKAMVDIGFIEKFCIDIQILRKEKLNELLYG